MSKTGPFWSSVRLSVAILVFFGFFNIFTLRINLSVAVVCMTNHSAIEHKHFDDHTSSQCQRENITHEKIDGLFDWSKQTQGILLSSFFYGYILMQIPGGLLAERFGAKNVFGIAMLIATIVTLISPFAAQFHYIAFVICRVILGLAEAVAYPATYVLFSNWAPPLERSVLTGFIHAGAQIGTVTSFPLASFLCSAATLISPFAAQFHYIAFVICRVILGLAEAVAYPATYVLFSNWAPPLERSVLTGFIHAGAQIGTVTSFPLASFLCSAVGWESIFYIFGSFALLWCLLWQYWTSSTPDQHRYISQSEKDYIVASLNGQVGSKRKRVNVTDMPWFQMLSSPPVWAIVIVHFCANYGTYLMLTSLPLYMDQVLNFDIKSNGFYSALPYLATVVGINIASNLADYLRKRNILSTTYVRKVMMVFSLGGQAGFFMAAGYCKCGQEIWAVAFIVLAQGAAGFQSAGLLVNHVDIAPRFAGTLFGISNTIAGIGGIIAPMLVAVLTEQGTREEWITVFWIAFGILIFGAVFYVIFASGEVQSWNNEGRKSTTDHCEIDEKLCEVV